MLSGKFVLRLDPETHLALKEQALARDESLNSYCVRLLKQAQGGGDPLIEGMELSQIIAKFKPLALILFGSAARGEATRSSDVDLLIVLPEDIPLTRQLYTDWDQFFPHLQKHSPQFTYFPKPHEDIGSLWLETALDGEILFASDSRAREAVQDIRRKIAEGRYRRKTSHGHAYWIRETNEK